MCVCVGFFFFWGGVRVLFKLYTLFTISKIFSFTGWLADNTGDYRVAFLLVGGMDVAIAGILLLLKLENLLLKLKHIICERM